MPASANTYSLDDYSQLNITSYRKHLAITQPDSLAASYNHNGKAYRYNIDLLKTPCNYGGYRYWWSCPKCSKRVGVLGFTFVGIA